MRSYYEKKNRDSWGEIHVPTDHTHTHTNTIFKKLYVQIFKALNSMFRALKSYILSCFITKIGVIYIA